jgi:UTP--glucose-1-phosphate uridylyltransferase
MQSFFYLFTRYLAERAQAQELSVKPCIFHTSSHLFFYRGWERIKSPKDDQIVPYSSLPKPKDSVALTKLAVLKVNGGLGTSMGMDLPRRVENFQLNPMRLHRYDWRQERA